MRRQAEEMCRGASQMLVVMATLILPVSSEKTSQMPAVVATLVLPEPSEKTPYKEAGAGAAAA